MQDDLELTLVQIERFTSSKHHYLEVVCPQDYHASDASTLGKEILA